MTNSFSQLISEYSQKVQDNNILDNNELSHLQLLLQESFQVALSNIDKDNLSTLFNYFLHNDIQHSLIILLFSVRFKKKLIGWDNNSLCFLADFWECIEQNLPLSHFEQNGFIKSIIVKDMDESLGQGDYVPSIKQIVLSYNMIINRPSDVVPMLLHEIGHAVRIMVNEDVIMSWFDSFGWHSFSDSLSGINSWINLMGGWDNLTSLQQSEIITCIRQCFNSEKTFKQGPPPQNLYPGHPWENFKVRDVYEKTFDYWFESLDESYKYNGYVFFFNFYYKKLMAVNLSTVEMIYDHEINRYALMGREEFFAELYSYYYDPYQREKLVPNIQYWFHNHVDSV
jgi:hypothetical protein